MEIIDQALDHSTEEKVLLNDDSWTVGTFMWTVKNFSRWFELREGPLRSETQDMLVSPLFTFDQFKGSWWYLVLLNLEEDGDISFGINRLETNIQVEKIEAEIEFSFLAADGSILIRKREQKSFSGEEDFLFENFCHEDEVLVQRKGEFLPNDILTARCRIWKISDKLANPVICFGHSDILLENGSSMFCVERFSNLEDGQKHYFDVASNILAISTWKICIYLNEDDVQVEIVTASNKESKRVMFEISAIDVTGNTLDSSTSDFDFQKGTVCLFSRFLTKSKVMAEKPKYLSNDKLILRCRYTIVYRNKVEYGRQFSKSFESHSSVLRELSCRNEKNTFMQAMSLVRDLADIYKNKTLSDVNIRVGTEIFTAHKLILSARSPVFAAKLTTCLKKDTIVMKDTMDMKKDASYMNWQDSTGSKKNTANIGIFDLDVDTVKMMLEYMYTDVVEDLHWNTATSLYLAAEKYQLFSLKDTCLGFLKANLSTINFCEALLFADMNNGDDLKNEIQDFLVRHDDEIIHSEAWNSLKTNNKQLAFETIEYLYLKKLEHK